MRIKRELIFLLLVLIAVLAIADGLFTAPGEHWYEKKFAESRRVQNKELITSEPIISDDERKEAMKKSAQAQWELAEWYYGRGELEKAREEYQRLIDDFPYLELDYGYRQDDARKRLLEIRKTLDEKNK